MNKKGKEMKRITKQKNKEIVKETAKYKLWLIKNATFSDALTEMILDHKSHCRRDGWDYEVLRLYIEEHDLVQQPYFVALINGEYETWIPSNNDLFANDWQIRGITHIPISDVVI